MCDPGKITRRQLRNTRQTDLSLRLPQNMPLVTRAPAKILTYGSLENVTAF